MPDNNGLEILESGAGDPAIEQAAAQVEELTADIEALSGQSEAGGQEVADLFDEAYGPDGMGNGSN